MFAPYKREPKIYKDHKAKIVSIWTLVAFIACVCFFAIAISLAPSWQLFLSIAPVSVVFAMMGAVFPSTSCRYVLREDAIEWFRPNYTVVSIPYSDVSGIQRTRTGASFTSFSGKKVWVSRYVAGGLDAFLREFDRLTQMQTLTAEPLQGVSANPNETPVTGHS